MVHVPNPHQDDEPLVIVGNALAGMVTALERSRAGRRTVLVSLGGPWGGHFAGLKFGGRRWDVGMVLYEGGGGGASDASELSSYDPSRRNDVGRFLGQVQRWIGRRQATRTISGLEMVLGGRRRPDLLLANRWEALRALPNAGRIREDLRATPVDGLWHPRHKTSWPRDGSDGKNGAEILYESVSRLNHGDTLHDTLLAPFVRKVLNREHSGLVALYHRIAWLPLFWPETLAQVLDGGTPALSPACFSHPVGEPVAALVAGAVAELKGSPHVTLHPAVPVGIRPGPRGCTLEFAQCGPMITRRLAWAGSPGQALSLAGLRSEVASEERLPLLIGLVRLPRAALAQRWSVIHLVDPGIGAYRVTDTSANAGDFDADLADLTIEANPQWFARVHPAAMEGEDEVAVLHAMVRDLVAAGLVATGSTPVFGHLVRLRGALPLPTADSVRRVLQAQAQLKAMLPDAALLGPAAGPFVGSLADQVVQGLALAQSSLRTACTDTVTAVEAVD